METAKTCSNATVRSSLSRHKPRFWDSPVPVSITRRSCRQLKRFLSGTGSTRSIPAGPSTEVAGLRPFLGEKGLLWGETVSGLQCAKWGFRGSTRDPISANGLWNTRSIPTCSGTLRPSIHTIYGGSISPTSACLTAGCTWWLLSTGTLVTSSPGRSIRPSRCRLSWMPWIGLFRPLSPRFSIATKGAISPVTATWNGFFPAVSWSVWTARDEPSIISSRNGYGEVSSMRKFTSTNTTVLDKPEQESGIGSCFITPKDHTNPWITKLLGKFSRKETNQYFHQPETERKSPTNRDTLSQMYVLKNRPKTVLTKPPTSLSWYNSQLLSPMAVGSVATLFQTTGIQQPAQNHP